MLRLTALRPLASATKAYPLPRAQPNVSSVRHFTQSITGGVRPIASPKLNRATCLQNALFKTSSIQLLQGRIMGEELKKEQEKRRHEKLKPDPESVTSTSSVRAVFEPAPKSRNQADDDPDMLRAIKGDLRTIKSTFALEEVPKEVFWIGMGGLTPYVVTSFSTLYLAWDINYATVTGTGYLVNKDTATYLLHLLEPTQIGLGAIILSFLGAVHWGLEMAEYGGKHPYRRYSIGILAPVLAWPTVMFPLDYALLTQFVGFVGMYFADSQATTWGWAPKWYTTYRFILTFVVGACIIITLIGRGQIGDAIAPTVGARKHLQDIRMSQRENMQKEEDARITRMVAEEAKAKKQHEKGEKAADPSKNAKGDKPGTQGVYSDKYRDTSGDNTPGQPTTPTPEKKGIQQPQPERKQSTGTKG